MADTILKKTDIEDLFRDLTYTLLGIPVKDNQNKPINQDKVRISWQSNGAPDWKITDDINFLRIYPNDDDIIQQRDVTTESKDSNYVNRIVQYTRCWSVQWVLYGPNSFDNIDTIRDGVFSPESYETLSDKNIYLITKVPAPTRAPELFNGQWWERNDLIVNFNEGVTRNSDLPFIGTTNIQVKHSI